MQTADWIDESSPFAPRATLADDRLHPDQFAPGRFDDRDRWTAFDAEDELDGEDLWAERDDEALAGIPDEEEAADENEDEAADEHADEDEAADEDEWLAEVDTEDQSRSADTARPQMTRPIRRAFNNGAVFFVRYGPAELSQWFLKGFKTGDSDLRGFHHHAIGHIAAEVCEKLRDGTYASKPLVVVRGRASSSGSWQRNRDLSRARADAVKSALVRAGLGNDLVKYEVRADGESRDALAGRVGTDDAESRHVEIKIYGPIDWIRRSRSLLSRYDEAGEPEDESPDELAERIAAQFARGGAGELEDEWEDEWEDEQPRRRRWTRRLDAAAIAGLRRLLIENQAAASANKIDRASCIVMLNVGVAHLLGLPTKQWPARSKSSRRVSMAKLTTKSIEAAMASLVASGHAVGPSRFRFLDRRGRTAGTLAPERLAASVSQAVLDASKPSGAWFAYGLSVMDGYHSVLLLVDATVSSPRIFWVDQFSPDVTVDVTTTLDDEITKRTQSWWQKCKSDKGVGYKTTARVWKLRRRV